MQAYTVDGRIPVKTARQKPVKALEHSSALLWQALETDDSDLIDWCINNTEIPDNIPPTHLNALLQALSDRFFVFSSEIVLEWIFHIICANKDVLKQSEYQEVVEECLQRMQTRTASFDWVQMLKARMDVMNFKQEVEEYEIIEEPLVEVEVGGEGMEID